MRRRSRGHVLLLLALQVLSQGLVLSAETDAEKAASEELPTLDGGSVGGRLAVGLGLGSRQQQQAAGKHHGTGLDDAAHAAGEGDRNRDLLLLRMANGTE